MGWFGAERQRTEGGISGVDQASARAGQGVIVWRGNEDSQKSHEQRCRRSKDTSARMSELRTRRVAALSQEAIDAFEKGPLKVFQNELEKSTFDLGRWWMCKDPRRRDDELSSAFEKLVNSPHKAPRPILKRGFSSESAVEDTATTEARSAPASPPASASNARALLRACSDPRSIRVGEQHEPRSIPIVEKDLNEIRPPSPVHNYDYGCISPKPRSAQGQRMQASGHQQGKAKHSQSAGCYFPGAKYKQGGYGISLLDPILLPCNDPKNFMGREPPERYKSAKTDVRPASAPTFDARRSGRPATPTGVPATRTHRQRADRVFSALDHRRDDDILEQVCFENGQSEGSWKKPPLKELPSEASEQQFDWLNQLDEMDEQDARLLAARILFGLIHVLATKRCKVSHLFASEERGGPPLVLEVPSFLSGLIRTGVLPDGAAAATAAARQRLRLEQALVFIDNRFDGTVSLKALSRAVTAAQAYCRERSKRETEQGRTERVFRKNRYHETLPIERVEVRNHDRTLFQFEGARKQFERQQQDMLVMFGFADPVRLRPIR